jgi:hypothetical protein
MQDVGGLRLGPILRGRVKLLRANEDIEVSGGVFICYRREDSSGFAGRIYDRLRETLGGNKLFIDVDNIAPGLDFVDVLSERVGKCDALLAVIGKDWVSSADCEKRRRLDDPHDFVRIEIEAALERDIRVIPVLVEGAIMPKPEDLPESLKKLSRRQGIEVSHTRFDSDVKILAHVLSPVETEPLQRSVAEDEAEEAAKQRAKAHRPKKVERGSATRQTQQLARAEGVPPRRDFEGSRGRRATSEEGQSPKPADAAQRAKQPGKLSEAGAMEHHLRLDSAIEDCRSLMERVLKHCECWVFEFDAANTFFIERDASARSCIRAKAELRDSMSGAKQTALKELGWKINDGSLAKSALLLAGGAATYMTSGLAAAALLSRRVRDYYMSFEGTRSWTVTGDKDVSGPAAEFALALQRVAPDVKTIIVKRRAANPQP